MLSVLVTLVVETFNCSRVMTCTALAIDARPVQATARYGWNSSTRDRMVVPSLVQTNVAPTPMGP